MLVGINGSFLRKKDSGIGQVTFNFLKNLAKISKKISDIRFIIYLEEDAELDLPRGFQKKIILPSYKRDDLLRKILWEKFVLPEEVRKDECDVFFSLYQSASIISGLPHLMLVHDAVWKVFPQYLNNFRKKIYYYFVEKAILKADRILTVSEYSKKDIVKIFGIDENKIGVSLIDCDSIFKNKPEESDAKKAMKKYGIFGDYIFYIGGFDVRKNVAGIIKAYGKFWKKYHRKIKTPDLVLSGVFHPHLVPLMDDVSKEIKEISEEFKIPLKKIKMIGFVEQEDVPRLYRNAKMLCYPSFYEGFGIPVLEAMSIGCPVITSSNSSIPEVANSQDAFIVDPENIEEISEAIFEVLSNEELVSEKVNQAKIDSQKFSWEKFTEKFLEEISNIKK